jgi:hypothetical protein
MTVPGRKSPIERTLTRIEVPVRTALPCRVTLNDVASWMVRVFNIAGSSTCLP